MSDEFKQNFRKQNLSTKEHEIALLNKYVKCDKERETSAHSILNKTLNKTLDEARNNLQDNAQNKARDKTKLKSPKEDDNKYPMTAHDAFKLAYKLQAKEIRKTLQPRYLVTINEVITHGVPADSPAVESIATSTEKSMSKSIATDGTSTETTDGTSTETTDCSLEQANHALKPKQNPSPILGTNQNNHILIDINETKIMNRKAYQNTFCNSLKIIDGCLIVDLHSGLENIKVPLIDKYCTNYWKHQSFFTIYVNKVLYDFK